MGLTSRDKPETATSWEAFPAWHRSVTTKWVIPLRRSREEVDAGSTTWRRAVASRRTLTGVLDKVAAGRGDIQGG